jgi:hypothetical protein
MTARPYSVEHVERATPEHFDDVTVESVDAAGDLTLVAFTGGPRLGHGRAANDLQRRADTWALNPTCAECGQRIASPEVAGFLVTADGPRVVCKLPCFTAAMRTKVAPVIRQHIQGGR